MASRASISDIAGPLYHKASVLKEFSLLRIFFSVLHLFKNAALLEYPQEYLDYPFDIRVNHHRGNWDDIYSSVGIEKPIYDLWLDKYEDILKDSIETPIIDLGCGYGNDTLYLHERGYSIISCDLSGEALKRLNHFVANSVTRQFDMLDGLPFKRGAAMIVIADLSLHYFSWRDTERIVWHIHRVLQQGGYVLCRVNSKSNPEYLTSEALKIEDLYYDFGQRKKRYFDRDHLERLFGDWDIRHIAEYDLERFGSTKVIWEIAASKRVGI